MLTRNKAKELLKLIEKKTLNKCQNKINATKYPVRSLISGNKLLLDLKRNKIGKKEPIRTKLVFIRSKPKVLKVEPYKVGSVSF